MLINKWIMFPALISTLLLSSCSTFTQPEAPKSDTPWANREAALSQINYFDINGKIAVRTPQDSGSATIHWVQNRDNFTIALYGPLGSNSMTLNGTPGSVSMETSDGKKVHASNAEELLAKEWGYHLPVSYLKYWIRGMPVPGIAANQQFDDSHRLKQLSQQGWNVQFLRYTRINGRDLPQKINATSPSLSAKMMIYTWSAR